MNTGKLKHTDQAKARNILETICNSQSHTNLSYSEVKEAILEIKDNLGLSDFTLDFDGAEYRLIHEDSIWEIYKEEIQRIVEDCYDLNLDKVPVFIALEVDWEQTAQNAYADGYGHTFSGYDGSEEECSGYYIFRTN
jgi:hypothetical protein